jgi:hypothetical protein
VSKGQNASNQQLATEKQLATENNLNFTFEFDAQHPNFITMKKWLLIGLIACTIAVFLMGYSDWHLDRNIHNKLPEGALTLTNPEVYVDEPGTSWALQPQSKNIFHQPDTIAGPQENPYPNLDHVPDFDRNRPNLKFLAKDGSGGSYEAILQPNGTWLTAGVLQGTYNFGHPEGIWGSIKHFFVDMLPGFVNSEYSDVSGTE